MLRPTGSGCADLDRGGSGKGGRLSPLGSGPARNTVCGGLPQTTGRRNGSGLPFRGFSLSVAINTPAPRRARFN